MLAAVVLAAPAIVAVDTQLHAAAVSPLRISPRRQLREQLPCGVCLEKRASEPLSHLITPVLSLPQADQSGRTPQGVGHNRQRAPLEGPLLHVLPRPPPLQTEPLYKQSCFTYEGVPRYERAASEPRGDSLHDFKDIYLKAKDRIWP